MINLLSPDIKEQMHYAKLNRRVLGYLRMLVLVLIVLTAIFGVTLYFLGQQANALTRDVADKQQTIASHAPNVKKSREAADRLTAIKTIQSTQTRFSLLLDDLAKVLPQGVAIVSITLTGDDTKPVRVTVTGDSYNSMLAFRDAAANSPRISGVDLENIAQNASSFQSSVVIGFKPGQAR